MYIIPFTCADLCIIYIFVFIFRFYTYTHQQPTLIRKMLKFIRGKEQKPTVDRQKLQKELFAYRKVGKS